MDFQINLIKMPVANKQDSERSARPSDESPPLAPTCGPCFVLLKK